MAKLNDAGSNPLHEDGQFRTHVWSTRHCVPSLSKTAYFHCSVHMTSAVDTDVKLNHSVTVDASRRVRERAERASGLEKWLSV